MRLTFFPFWVVNLLTRGFPAFFRYIFRLLGYGAVLGGICLILLASYFYVKALKYDMKLVAQMPERTIVLDRNDREIGRLHGEKRDIIPLSDVAPVFQDALLAREDARFYSHGAMDFRGLVRAMIRNIKDRRVVQGASTITMQLARNTFPLGGKTLNRKALEIAVAYRIEQHYEKKEVLEHYINRIFWGGSIRGVEEASRTYFEKSAKQLTLSEAALLAGIIRGPNSFSPFKDIKKAQRERDTTLQSMLNKEMITSLEAETAMREPIKIRPQGRRSLAASYAMDTIRRELNIILEKENIELGGLTIKTTVDLLLQGKAEDALNDHLTKIEQKSGFKHQTRAKWRNLPTESQGDPAYLQGSLVIVENKTGRILTVVGGRNADESQYNRAIQAKRQIGSIFKPFVYLAAFTDGLMPATTVSDGPIKSGEIGRLDNNWQPKNSDGKFRGMKPASYGLVHSRNTMSVRVGDFAGISEVKETARQVGLGKDVPEKASAYLGSWESSTWDVASAFTVFPNNGIRYRPFIIDEIRKSNGEVVYRTGQISYPAAESGPSAMVSEILEDVIDSGTGKIIRNLGFREPCAGKTGTTDNFRDAWFAGYTSELSCAVWVGMDKPARIINAGYGSTLAAPIWTEVMKSANRLGYKAQSLSPNLPMKTVQLCQSSGKRPTALCYKHNTVYTEAIPSQSAPEENDLCPVHPIKAERVNHKNIPQNKYLDAPRAERVEPKAVRAERVH